MLAVVEADSNGAVVMVEWDASMQREEGSIEGSFEDLAGPCALL